MKISYNLAPLERDENGEIHDFEKTWVCFTMTVKKAQDERAAADALEFIEWYTTYKADIPSALLGCTKYENGIYSDTLTFDRDKSMKKGEQVRLIQITLKKAKSAYKNYLATAVPPHILTATKAVA